MKEQTLTKYDLKSSRFLAEQFRYLETHHKLRFEKHYCLCPFHPETKPSFSQYIDGNGFVRYKCFGCNINEDFFGVMMRLEKRLGFDSAISRFKNFVQTNSIGGSSEIPINRSQDNHQRI